MECLSILKEISGMVWIFVRRSRNVWHFLFAWREKFLRFSGLKYWEFNTSLGYTVSLSQPGLLETLSETKQQQQPNKQAEGGKGRGDSRSLGSNCAGKGLWHKSSIGGRTSLMCNVASLCLSQLPVQTGWHRVLRPDRAYVLTKLRVTRTRGYRHYIWTTIPSSDLIPLRPDSVRELELDVPFLGADLTPLPLPTSSRDSRAQDGHVCNSKVLHYSVSERNWS